MTNTVLLADRDPSLREDFQHILERRRYEVFTAADGLECLELLRTVGPKVLLLERELLWGGGDGVLALLESDASLPKVHVVLIADEEDPPEVLPAPVVASFRKPFRIGALLDLLQQISADGSGKTCG